eukprot:jgi/Botrbrau1/16210/Bobra.314_2s0004.1
MLLNGRSHAGNLYRLRNALHKLIAGQPITVAALGGSIMFGGETYMARKEKDPFLSQMFMWLNASFPHPGHKFHNGAMPASESTFFATCLRDHLPHEDVDLVILEFDINDCESHYAERNRQTYLDNVRRRGLESLMRQVLQLPNHPAVLYMHIWMPGRSDGQFCGTNIEDETELLVRYYGLQSLSMRDALFEHYIANRIGFRESDIACNDVHPNYLYHRYMADMLISFLQDNMAGLLVSPVTPRERGLIEEAPHSAPAGR